MVGVGVEVEVRVGVEVGARVRVRVRLGHRMLRRFLDFRKQRALRMDGAFWKKVRAYGVVLPLAMLTASYRCYPCATIH